MKLAVLTPAGRDPIQDFPDGAGAPNDAAHPPNANRAFAACTSGTYCRKDQEIPADQKHVLVLVGDNLKACRQVFVELRSVGKTIAIAWKDPTPAQIAELLSKPARFKLFQEICQRADGAIATTPDLVTFFTAAGVRHTEFIPAPWPLDDARWDLSAPIEERRGIFVGTREFRVPARHHLATLARAPPTRVFDVRNITLLNADGERGRGLIERLGYDPQLLQVVDARMTYPRYLRLLAKHKLVWQLDTTGGLGQVAGDALLARIPCIGGLGATERVAYPDLCGHGRDSEQLFDLAARLLEHPHDCEAVMERALTNAREKLSFSAATQRLETFFKRISR